MSELNLQEIAALLNERRRPYHDSLEGRAERDERAARVDARLREIFPRGDTRVVAEDALVRYVLAHPEVLGERVEPPKESRWVCDVDFNSVLPFGCDEALDSSQSEVVVYRKPEAGS